MKWNVLLGTVVLGLGLCTQSYGFELLDRMLGVNDCGCNNVRLRDEMWMRQRLWRSREMRMRQWLCSSRQVWL